MKKRFLSLLLCAVLALSLLPAGALADETPPGDGETVYTVILDPGEGTGEPIVFRSDKQDEFPTDWRKAENCQFYYEDDGAIAFRLGSNYCPDTFSAPVPGMFVDSWQGSAIYNRLSSTETTFTAKWRIDPNSADLYLLSPTEIIVDSPGFTEVEFRVFGLPSSGYLGKVGDGLDAIQLNLQFWYTKVDEFYISSWLPDHQSVCPCFDFDNQSLLERTGTFDVYVDPAYWNTLSPGTYTIMFNYQSCWTYQGAYDPDFCIRRDNRTKTETHSIPLTLNVTGDTPGGYPPPVTFTVTFDVNTHGKPMEAVTVNAGEPAAKPADPTASGYRFGGWYTEPACVNAYDFSNPVTGELVLYAKWTPRPTRSGGGGGGGSVTYGVTADKSENGSVTASPTYAAQGRTVTLTVKPDEGFHLDTMTVTDKSGNDVAVTDKADGTCTFIMPASAVTVKAVFAADPAPDPAPEPEPAEEGCPKDGTCPVSWFDDTSPDRWYHDGVHWALENGVMNGVGNDRFDPNGTATRAMVVTMLWRLEGEPAGTTNPFTDVPSDTWYAPAVCWAAEQGVVNGVSDTAFDPDAAVTREQLAAVLYRCAQAEGRDVSVGEDTNILSYDDAFDISEWAIPAMQWACGAGAIAGKTASTLAPQDQATRAEIATVFQRFCEAAAE